MARIRLVENGFAFRCPGCGDTHVVPTTGDVHWTWNGSIESPTISPSLRVRSGHYAPSWKPGDECWCGKDYGFTCYECHSTIADGRITFSGCSHAFEGQTVELPEVVR